MLTRLIRFSLERPSLILVMAAALLIYAGAQFSQTPVDVFPELNAPTVTIIAPQPNAAVQGAFDLTWTAEDSDGDDLTYSIYYEPKPDSLIPVDALLKETSYRLDTSLWSASSSASLRVVAV